MSKAKDEQVTIYPVEGRFLVGVPAVEQTVEKDEAEGLIETGAFTAEKPPEPAAEKPAKGKAADEPKDAEPEKAPA